MTSSRTLTARVAALTLAAALATGLTGCSILNTLTGTVTRDATGAATEGNGNADVFTIKVGDCLNDATVQDEEVDHLPLVPCDQPHDTEVVASVLLDDGDFPGDDAVTAAAEDKCLAAFEQYVGISYDDSALEYSYYSPTEGSWTSGDREILCTVYDPNGKITGSLKGAAA